ncbi:MAG: bifunctional endoribonuclease/protein kinase ire1 [Sclerophora amabilis]|nr:MAG: bifunctional endoribonuclease/protein kinase ire1 [Sclerophora amabilis]
MARRPPGAARVAKRAVLALIFTVPLVLAAQQQQQQQDHDEASPQEEPPGDILSSLEPLRLEKRTFETAQKPLKDTVFSNDASAVATLAPAGLDHAVRAPPARFSGKSAGLSSPLHARSLQDWEVEDFLLLATVDGTIYARDRKTGASRWALEVDRAMVETTYHRANKSSDSGPRPEDDFLWIVEPSRDGSLYIYNPGPNAGLQKLGLTVKKLVEELSPYAGEDPPVVYTAEKKNTLYNVDARSGRVLKMFSSGGSSVTDENSCRRVNGLEHIDDEECGSGGTLTLGRTEYTVGIQSRDTGDAICTLRYSEWGPNNRDSDLHSQYFSTMDKKYVYSRHDGSIFGFDLAQEDERRKLYTQKFSSPVARVFDVARPLDTERRDAPLVVLPQPVGPADQDKLSATFLDRNGRIFINCTESGGWYAMSESTYPLVTGGASLAQCYTREWLEATSSWDQINPRIRNKALIGVHSITDLAATKSKLPTISGPNGERANDSPIEVIQHSPALSSTPAIANSRLLGYAAENAVDIGILLPFMIFILFIYVNRRKFGKMVAKTFDVEKIPGVKEALMSPPPTPAIATEPFSKSFADQETAEGRSDEEDGSRTPTEPKKVDSAEAKTNGVRFEEPRVDEIGAPLSPPQPKKKKTHRGQRGGAGRKKGKKDANKDSERDSVDRIVEEVKQIGKDQPLEPDVINVNGPMSNSVTDVSGPFQINNLVVTDTVIGYGSHGTIVYRGSFEGREVAVKRMLLEFYDVASHEVGLLQESDDHPNVIRYFCRQQSSGFLYIALELCPASLQDVVEKSHDFTSLAQASLLDLPNVLFQIAAGVKHLHSLKIVHRDLKPQNILVAAPKVPRNNPNAVLPPRLLISDFGLCKKLDGDQSSFRATTAHAAGTSGWRAPELLVDDDTVSQAPPLISESGHSAETSEPAVIDSISNRRATRAIDIFSLGCVFFYILSGGNHPFGDRYMREANIVKGHYKLHQLDPFGYEAMDLIEQMLDHNPRRRPDATEVMSHLFFWSAEKQLNFLVDVSDHFEYEERDPPSEHLLALESVAPEVLGTDFLKRLDKAFIDHLGKQRKYTGSKMLDLLRALRNKKNHYLDMPEHVKAHVGPLPDGYLSYWTRRFPALLLRCYQVVKYDCKLDQSSRFRPYFELPAGF